MTEPIVEKVCNCCKELTPIEKFRLRPQAKDGRDAQCAKCLSVKALKRWHETKTPERTWANHLWQRYKMRPHEYDALLAAQDGKCGICGGMSHDAKRLRVDHCHETGKIRGLLCSSCNTAIGALGDSIEGLERAMMYFQRFQEGEPPQPAKVKLSPRTGLNHHWHKKT